MLPHALSLFCTVSGQIALLTTVNRENVKSEVGDDTGVRRYI
jgi:hypothetical protein